MPWCCSWSTPSTMGSSSRRSSLACGWRRWGIWPTSPGWFPKALGVLLVVGCVCYLVDMLAAFLVPDFGQNIHTFVTIPSAIAEIWMVGYLLVIGVKAQKPEKRILAAVAMPGAEA